MRISDWSSDVALPISGPAAGRRRRSGRGSRPSPRRCAASRSRRAGAGGRRGGCAFESRRAAEFAEPVGRAPRYRRDRKSVVEGKRVYVRVDLGGRRTLKKKKQKNTKVMTQKKT